MLPTLNLLWTIPAIPIPKTHPIAINDISLAIQAQVFGSMINNNQLNFDKINFYGKIFYEYSY